MTDIPEFWTDESEPQQLIFYHVGGDKIFQTQTGFERHWSFGVVTTHATLEEAFDAEVPEYEG